MRSHLIYDIYIIYNIYIYTVCMYVRICPITSDSPEKVITVV